MAEEIAFKNGKTSNFQGLVTLTLTLDRVILHTIVYHSSTSTYKPNFIEMEENVCGRTDGFTDGRTFETGLIRSTLSKSHSSHSTFLTVLLSLSAQQSASERLSSTHGDGLTVDDVVGDLGKLASEAIKARWTYFRRRASSCRLILPIKCQSINQSTNHQRGLGLH